MYSAMAGELIAAAGIMIELRVGTTSTIGTWQKRVRRAVGDKYAFLCIA
jgi:hypothetical protein